MPDVSSTLQILVDVKNGQESAGQIRDVGSAGEEAGAGAEKAAGGFGGMAKKLAIAAGGAVAVKKGFDFLKDAAGAAESLAKSTAGLQRITGMDARAASGWVSMAKERGIQSDQLNKGLVIFSKQLVGAQGSSKKSAEAFDKLGVSAKALKNMKTEDAIAAVADGFKKMPAGAEKAALSQQLLGRSSQKLLPLFNSGSEGIAEQMAMMKKYGLTMDESGVQKGLELAKAQREQAAATSGLKVALGTALLPVMTSIAKALTPIVAGFTWLTQNVPGFTYIVIGLAAGLGALVIASTVASAFGALAAAFGLTSGALLGLIGTALLAAAPFIAIGLAIVAVGVGLVILYKKVGWFHDAVDAAFGAIKSAVSAAFDWIVQAAKTAFNWIKGNWPLLLGILTGPFGLAIALIITHFGKIKKVAGDAFGTVQRLASDAWNGMTKGIRAAVDTIINLINKIPDAAKSVVDKVKGFFGGIGSAAGDFASSLNPVKGLKGLLKGQHGLTMPGAGGLALVGEAGPELLQLPGGARVTPLAAGTSPPVSGAGGGGDIHVHVEVDGRELAHVLARQTADRQAMR
jgi:hypothetical protein